MSCLPAPCSYSRFNLLSNSLNESSHLFIFVEFEEVCDSLGIHAIASLEEVVQLVHWAHVGQDECPLRSEEYRATCRLDVLTDDRGRKYSSTWILTCNTGKLE